MKHTRTILLVLSVFTLAAILLSACGPAATAAPRLSRPLQSHQLPFHPLQSRQLPQQNLSR